MRRRIGKNLVAFCLCVSLLLSSVNGQPFLVEAAEEDTNQQMVIRNVATGAVFGSIQEAINQCADRVRENSQESDQENGEEDSEWC